MNRYLAPIDNSFDATFVSPKNDQEKTTLTSSTGISMTNMKRGVDPEASTSSREREEGDVLLSSSDQKKTTRGPPPPLPAVPRRLNIAAPPALAAENNDASPPRIPSTGMDKNTSPISPLRYSVQELKARQRSQSGIITSEKNKSGVVVGFEGGNVLVSWSTAPKDVLSYKREELTGISDSSFADPSVSLPLGTIVHRKILAAKLNNIPTSAKSVLSTVSPSLDELNARSRIDSDEDEHPPPLPDDFGLELGKDVSCCPLEDLEIVLEGDARARLRPYQLTAMADLRAGKLIAGVMLETDAFGDVWYKTNKKTRLKIVANPTELSVATTNILRQHLLEMVRSKGVEEVRRLWQSKALKKHLPAQIKTPDLERHKDYIEKFLSDAFDVAESNRLRVSVTKKKGRTSSPYPASLDDLIEPKIKEGGYYKVRHTNRLVRQTRLRREPILGQNSVWTNQLLSNGDIVKALGDPVPDKRKKGGPDMFLEVQYENPSTKAKKRGFIRIMNLRDLKGRPVTTKARPFNLFALAKEKTIARITDKDTSSLDMSTCETALEVKSLLSTGLLNKMSVHDLWLNDEEVAIEAGKTLGSGGAALIHKGYFRQTPIAMKEMLHVLIYPSLENVAREGWLLVRLRHPNIVHFYGVWQRRDYDLDTYRIYLCMELCQGGNLRTAIDTGKNLDARLTWKWLRQVTMAVDYMHSRQPSIIHRDLKPENVLLTAPNGDCKLCDFGLACQTSERSVGFVADLGTLAYMPPEVLRANRTMLSRASSLSRSAKKELAKMAAANLKLGKQWDVYSCAMIFSFVLTRVVPFDGATTEEILSRVCDEHVQGRPKLDFVPGAAPVATEHKLKSMIRTMWHDQAKARPGLPFILEQLQQIFPDV